MKLFNYDYRLSSKRFLVSTQEILRSVPHDYGRSRPIRRGLHEVCVTHDIAVLYCVYPVPKIHVPSRVLGRVYKGPNASSSSPETQANHHPSKLSYHHYHYNLIYIYHQSFKTSIPKQIPSNVLRNLQQRRPHRGA